MKNAWWVADPLFGDGGKGALTNWLVATCGATLDLRYTGGAQSGRTVTWAWHKHTFHTWGAGTREGALTVLAPTVRFDPYAAINEGIELQHLAVVEPWKRLVAYENCLVVTPYHIAESQRAIPEHGRGSTGMGVGTAFRHWQEHKDEAIMVRDLRDPDFLYDRLSRQQVRFKQAAIEKRAPVVRRIVETFLYAGEHLRVITHQDWRELRAQHQVIVAEGAHGFWLDRDEGFKPYVTSSKTDFTNAKMMFYDEPERHVRKIGVIGLYMSRHGPGPFPTECAELAHLPADPNQLASEGQGDVRRGWLDLALIGRANTHLLLDELCLNRVDHWSLRDRWTLATTLRTKTDKPIYKTLKTLDDYIACIEDQLSLPVTVIGAGMQQSQYHWREAWNAQRLNA